MEITDNEYLQQILKTAKLELREIEVQYRVTIAEFRVKSDMLQKQIDSIEQQLANPAKKADC